jgi:hypothetical protein
VAGLIPFLLLAFLPALLPVRGQVPVSAKVDAFLVLDLSVRSTPPPEFSFCVSAEAPGARVRVCASTFAGQASVASVMRPFINSDFVVLVRIIVSGSQYRF